MCDNFLLTSRRISHEEEKGVDGERDEGMGRREEKMRRKRKQSRKMKKHDNVAESERKPCAGGGEK